MPDLELKNKFQESKTPKDYIEPIFQQLLTDYQETKAERNGR